MKLWIVGKGVDFAVGSWEFQGVFSSEARAVEACRAAHYFCAPAILDESLPDETLVDWPGARYPKAE